MEAGLRLPLEKDPFCALAFCAMLLAHAQGDSASRLVLATAPAAQLLAKLLQVRHGTLSWHRCLKRKWLMVASMCKAEPIQGLVSC